MKWIALIVLLASPAAAEEANFLIEVRGTSYLDGPCEVNRTDTGSITIGVSETHPSKYFAYINSEAGGPTEGYWNGELADSHAHNNLGQMTAAGDCWRGRDSRVCAYPNRPTDIGMGN